MLTVRGPAREEEVQLADEIPEDDWPDSASSCESPDELLNTDAWELLATEVTEVLRLWELTWPICRTHQHQMFPLLRHLVLQRAALPRDTRRPTRRQQYRPADAITRPSKRSAGTSARLPGCRPCQPSCCRPQMLALVQAFLRRRTRRGLCAPDGGIGIADQGSLRNS